MTFDNLLEKYRKTSYSERNKGTRFEKLMQGFMKTYPPYLGKFNEVWMWNEFPFRKDFGGKDTGIDLVARTVEGDYWAIQCKCYQTSSRINKPEVDSFLSTSSKTFQDELGRTTKFAQRLWISTTDKWNHEAENTIAQQDPPVARIGLYDLRNALIDWDKLDQGIFGTAAIQKERVPKDHQQEAINSAHEYYKSHDRGKLIMACGTGKTYTSLKIAEQETGPHGLVLFLVPSIALLGQTLNEWSTFAKLPIDAICVCSDAAASKKTKANDDLQNIDLALPATTDVRKVAARIQAARERLANPAEQEQLGMTVVFSTYQSIEVVAKAQKYLMTGEMPDDHEITLFTKEELAQKDAAEFAFDMIICDEAHRTTGMEESSETNSAFTLVHDNSHILARRRMYMTATPRLYTTESKKKAAQSGSVILYSMDNAEQYGDEFYRIGFGRAVEKNLLADYKVIVLTIGENQIPAALQQAIMNPESEIESDDASKLIGCINALSKRMVEESNQLKEIDPQPMHTALAFCSRISDSKKIKDIFNEYKDAYYDSLGDTAREETVDIEAQHVDGSMGASERDEKLQWLKAAPRSGKECRILTNVRCLSEGVDVPALDAVLFLSARKSQVDVVQSVGRVMRTAPGKKYGYIIIPVIIPVDQNPEDALDNNKTFDVVWSVLNALRAHDDRFNATINKLELNKNKAANGHILVGSCPDDPSRSTYDTGDGQENGAGAVHEQTVLYFDELQGAIYARMVQKVGSRRYWEQWAKDIAEIAARHKERIAKLVSTDQKHQKAFARFMKGLHSNINPYISNEDAIEMLAQHIITRPVFEALFENYDFVRNNIVSKSMEKVLALLDQDGMEKDQEQMQRFYDSVKERCAGVDNAEGKQKIIIELYDKFFKTALPKTVGKLGIVYTPVEVVDFILNSVNDVLKKEFGHSLSDNDVHILDPFTGTGTFITRLLQSGIIQKKDLLRKYTQELHANEIVLLAYYIASINIENTFHDLMEGDDYTSFNGICLTDTFELTEDSRSNNMFPEFFRQNTARVVNQQMAPIRVIVGNPPYSVGQSSANDNNQNETYPHLEQRISETYVAGTNATNKNALYDSYIKAFRWASDRLDEESGGVIGFVSNAGWLDGAAMDGMRSCLEKEFSSIYIFNLRGNARTNGERRRRESGNVFGGGSRTPVAITILVKNPKCKNEKAEIFYHDIGDYLTREEKLKIISEFKSCMNRKFSDVLTVLKPNEYNDWLNKRNGLFETFISIGDKKDKENHATVFIDYYSNGLKTQRDAWCYNFSQSALVESIKGSIDYYNEERHRYQKMVKDGKENEFSFDMNQKQISWTDGTKSNFKRNRRYKFKKEKIVYSMYRPFCVECLYYDNWLNERVYQIPKIFPTGREDNVVICVSGISSTKEMSVIITDKIPDLHFNGDTQAFPKYYYEESSTMMDNLFSDTAGPQYIRHDGITDFIWKEAASLYGKKVKKEDIFYYVYGFLHLPAYRKEFVADLKKSLPRILLVKTPKKFWKIAEIGRALADLHLHYEQQEAPEGVKVKGWDCGNYRVKKMKFKSKKDKSAIIYNDEITISDIPLEAYNYVVNGKSAIEWIMDRYQVKIDKKSGILNDPNDWGKEHDEPRYILDFLLSVITVSIETLKLIGELPEVDFNE